MGEKLTKNRQKKANKKIVKLKKMTNEESKPSKKMGDVENFFVGLFVFLLNRWFRVVLKKC